MPARPTLAIDLGGTKLAAALVDGPTVVARRQTPIDRDGGVAIWLDALVALVEGWRDWDAAGVAVTGLVREGRWRALNPATLPVPDGFDLEAALRHRMNVPVVARNDAQAAAWGEYRYGAGRNADMLFVTVSTGIGGGLVLDGKLRDGRAGLAGHLGITPVETPDGVQMLEALASGTALGARTVDAGGAQAVATAAETGDPAASAIMDAVVAPLALALRRLQLVLDVDAMVIGGGLGLAPGYLSRLRRHLAPLPDLLRPTLRAAALGADAGLVGIADLARRRLAGADPA